MATLSSTAYSAALCMTLLKFLAVTAVATGNGGEPLLIGKIRAKMQTHKDRHEIKGVADKTKPVSSCCQNGGLCILGSFCHCPKTYYGRYCEFQMKQRDCGTMKHGDWKREDCNLCQCTDSFISCIPKVFDGCDDDNSSQTEVTVRRHKSHKPTHVRRHRHKLQRKSHSSGTSALFHFQTFYMELLTLTSLLVLFHGFDLTT